MEEEKCYVCYDIMHQWEKVELSCSHSICKNCLGNIISSTDSLSIRCPFCRTYHVVIVFYTERKIKVSKRKNRRKQRQSKRYNGYFYTISMEEYFDDYENYYNENQYEVLSN